jgi:hypothetical protein
MNPIDQVDFEVSTVSYCARIESEHGLSATLGRPQPHASSRTRHRVWAATASATRADEKRSTIDRWRIKNRSPATDQARLRVPALRMPRSKAV